MVVLFQEALPPKCDRGVCHSAYLLLFMLVPLRFERFVALSYDKIGSLRSLHV